MRTWSSCNSSVWKDNSDSSEYVLSRDGRDFLNDGTFRYDCLGLVDGCGSMLFLDVDGDDTTVVSLGIVPSSL
jgi:hypothetical protein